MAAELPALRARGRLHHGHGLTLPAPHASATPLHLRLPHLVHALADLLLEREVLRALERREESGELLLFLFLEVDALGRLRFGGDYAMHAVDEEEFLRHYNSERRLMKR